MREENTRNSGWNEQQNRNSYDRNSDDYRRVYNNRDTRDSSYNSRDNNTYNRDNNRGIDNLKRFRSTDTFIKKPKHVPADPNNTIGIFGFNQFTTDEDVRCLLKNRIGHIKGYTHKLIIDERTGFCKGFCFVDFKCLEDAINAKDIFSFERYFK